MVSRNSLRLGQISDQEIRLLRVFKSVAECGGFAAAETELGIGRSTISIHIGKLESRLNLKLCRRGRAGFALTEEGSEVYQLMSVFFSSMEHFRSGINALHVELTGELKVITSDTICLQERAQIPQIIGQFCSVAPEVQLVLDVREMMAIEQLVLNNEADVGFVHSHREFDGLQYDYLYKTRCCLYCSCSHLLADVDKKTLSKGVMESKLVHSGVQTSSEIGELLAGMDKAAISYSYESRLAMILSGVYIGFLPDFYVEEYLRDGSLVTLLPNEKFYDLNVAAITRSHSKSNRAKDVFMEVVHDFHGQ